MTNMQKVSVSTSLDLMTVPPFCHDSKIRMLLSWTLVGGFPPQESPGVTLRMGKRFVNTEIYVF